MPRCWPEVPAPSSCQARIPLIFKTHYSAAALRLDQCESFILTSSCRRESTHISPNLPCSLPQSHQQKSRSSIRSGTGTAPEKARPQQLRSQVRVFMAVASCENIRAGTLQRGEGSWRTDGLLLPRSRLGKAQGSWAEATVPGDGGTSLGSQSLGNQPQGLLRSSTQPAGGAQNHRFTPEKPLKTRKRC